MSIKILGSPSKYIQGAGEIENIYHYISKFGESFFVIADEVVTRLLSEKIKKSFEKCSAKLNFEQFNGESTYQEVDRIIEIFKSKKGDVIIGVGGGKALDTAKLTAHKCGVPLVIVPTIASTDAPCSALAVIYTDKGAFVSDYFLPQNPDIVIVDVEVIAQAPSRLLVSGMGDAFATYYEARACKAADADNMFKGKATNAAYALAQLSNTILLEDGLKAKIAVDNKIITKALENIVETNIYLSGVGFESNGVAVAHGIYNGFTTLERAHKYYHGECVAFGTIVQLELENAPKSEIYEVLNFFFQVGLPMTFEDLGWADITLDEIAQASQAVVDGIIAHNMPFEVTYKDIYGAILAAEAEGKLFKQRIKNT